jgi:ribonuclease Z
MFLKGYRPHDLLNCLKAMIFTDCPSTDYIPSLVGSTAFSRFQRGGEYPIHCMFHRVGPKVLDDPRYRHWLETFGDKVHVRDLSPVSCLCTIDSESFHKHLVAGPCLSPDRIAFTSTAYAQLRLSHLDSQIFQVPKYLSSSSPTEKLGGHGESALPESLPFIALHGG